jgi:ferrochelatase
MKNRAIVLANLGSPDAPEETAVRRYLDQFLMDPWVIQLPWLLRRLIVSLLVLPKRPRESAEAYQSVWLPEGSPLVVLSRQLQQAVQACTEMPVFMAMRYGQPSIESVLAEVSSISDIEEVLFIPLYPHYADSTVTTSVELARRWVATNAATLKLKVFPPFFADDDYIQALVASSKPYLDKDHDHILFSYHGLPESHLKKADPTGIHCLASENCCSVASTAHRTCYRHQVLKTTECFAASAGLDPERYTVAFQSRLGRAKWLEPATEETLRVLAGKGIKRLLVLCPAFVTDCLETIEEIGMRGQEVFLEAGGESLELVPCLNDHAVWVQVLEKWINQPH